MVMAEGNQAVGKVWALIVDGSGNRESNNRLVCPRLFAEQHGMSALCYAGVYRVAYA